MSPKSSRFSSQGGPFNSVAVAKTSLVHHGLSSPVRTRALPATQFCGLDLNNAHTTHFLWKSANNANPQVCNETSLLTNPGVPVPYRHTDSALGTRVHAMPLSHGPRLQPRGLVSTRVGAVGIL